MPSKGDRIQMELATHESALENEDLLNSQLLAPISPTQPFVPVEISNLLRRFVPYTYAEKLALFNRVLTVAVRGVSSFGAAVPDRFQRPHDWTCPDMGPRSLFASGRYSRGRRALPGWVLEQSYIFSFLAGDQDETRAAIWQCCRDLCPPHLRQPRMYSAFELQQRIQAAVAKERRLYRDIVILEAVQRAVNHMDDILVTSPSARQFVDGLQVVLESLIGELGCHGMLYMTNNGSTRYDGNPDFEPEQLNVLEEIGNSARDDLREMHQRRMAWEIHFYKMRDAYHARNQALQMIRDLVRSQTPDLPADPNTLEQMCDDALAGYDLSEVAAWRAQPLIDRVLPGALPRPRTYMPPRFP